MQYFCRKIAFLCFVFLYLISLPLCQVFFCAKETPSAKSPLFHHSSLATPPAPPFLTSALQVLSCLIMSFWALLITFYPLSAAGFIAHSILLLFAVPGLYIPSTTSTDFHPKSHLIATPPGPRLVWLMTLWTTDSDCVSLAPSKSPSPQPKPVM